MDYFIIFIFINLTNIFKTLGKNETKEAKELYELIIYLLNLSLHFLIYLKNEEKNLRFNDQSPFY